MTLLSELAKLNEDVQPLPNDMDLEDQMAELEKRMGAAKRGLSFSHRLKNPLQKKKHFSSVLRNMNQIRGQLSRCIKQLEQFTQASSEYETGGGYGDTGPQPDTQQSMPGANRAEDRAAFANT